MTQTGTRTQPSATPAERLGLARITGAMGIVTLVVVLGASLANDYQSASFESSADEAVTFFRSLDDGFGAFSSFATAVGLIAMLWFTLGLALLLRRYEGELPWRSVFLAGAGVISVVSGQIASWDAAVIRSDDIDPQVARYAFDLGNMSFANGWVAAGAVGICAGLIVLSTRDLPHWLGWWAILAGVGSVLARTVWTEGYAMVPFTAFWVWVAVLSVLLLLGRFATGDER
ncbi:MAG TPA: hypothetical protein VGJ41_09985 [Nocardioides sp.]|jgi:hypothetical protein